MVFHSFPAQGVMAPSTPEEQVTDDGDDDDDDDNDDDNDDDGNDDDDNDGDDDGDHNMDGTSGRHDDLYLSDPPTCGPRR